MKSLLSPVLSGLLLFFVNSSALAWGFDEHVTLGTESYLRACTFLKENLSDEVDLENSELKTLERELFELSCSDKDIRSRLYGQRTALSADHIKEYNDLEGVKGELESLSMINYGLLALENYSHFWPEVKKQWRKHHQLALKHAIKGNVSWKSGNTLAAKLLLEKALMISAFADHFLQDAFAIGHNGFSRPNSLQNPSLILHDSWNEAGRYFYGKHISQKRKISSLKKSIYFDHSDKETKDCLTEYSISDYTLESDLRVENDQCQYVMWKAYGDGNLALHNDQPDISNSINELRILIANRDAILSVMTAFIYGRATEFSLFSDDQFPLATESFPFHSPYTFDIEDFSVHDCLKISPNNYQKANRCWFDLENTITEPVYPGFTVSFTSIKIPEFSSHFSRDVDIVSHIYGGKTRNKYFPVDMRFLVRVPTSSRTDIPYRHTRGGFGLNFVLPNFYLHYPISHELEIINTSLSDTNADVNEDADLETSQSIQIGINTNIDILRARLALTTAVLFPNNSLKDHVFAIGVSLGWTFRVAGGGPLRRW